MMKLHKLSKELKKKKKKRRVGRGYGSGRGGHTVGRGQKGQKSRSGYKKLRSFIRTTNIRSLPKLRGIGKRSALRGVFKTKLKVYVLNVSDLEGFNDKSTIDIAFLRKNDIVTNKSKKVFVKILGRGEITKSLTIQGLEVSKSAHKKIKAAGGKVLS